MRLGRVGTPESIDAVLGYLLTHKKRIGGKAVIRKSRVMHILGDDVVIPNEVISFIPALFYHPMSDEMVNASIDVDAEWVIEQLQKRKKQNGRKK